MEVDLDYLSELLSEIRNGRDSFLTIGHGTAQTLMSDTPTTMTNAEAERLRQHLDHMERMGTIKIMFKSSDGIYSGVRAK